MLTRVGLSLGLVVGSLAVGWWLHRRGRLSERQASQIIRWIVRVPTPVVLCLSIWKMDLRSPDPWLLPFVGLAVSASAMIPALCYTRMAALSRPQIGSFLTCAFSSNLGYFGAFTAFAVFGEEAYAMCLLYLVFFVPCFYTLGFSIAARYGERRKPDASTGTALGDDLRFYPFLGIVVGAVLSLAGVPRPVPLEWLNHALIPIDTTFYLIAIGSQLTFASPSRPLWAPCLMMSGIKFLYTPLIAWWLVNALNLQGLPRVIVLLQAATPVAVSPMVLPLLFGLDRKLANALWLVTTVLAIPVFVVLLPLLASL